MIPNLIKIQYDIVDSLINKLFLRNFVRFLKWDIFRECVTCSSRYSQAIYAAVVGRYRTRNERQNILIIQSQITQFVGH